MEQKFKTELATGAMFYIQLAASEQSSILYCYNSLEDFGVYFISTTLALDSEQVSMIARLQCLILHQRQESCKWWFQPESSTHQKL